MSASNAEFPGELSPITMLTQAAEAQFVAAQDLIVPGLTEDGRNEVLYLAGPPVGTSGQQNRFSGSLALNGKLFNAKYRPAITAKPYRLTRETTNTGGTYYNLDTVPEDHFATEGRMEPENIAVWNTADNGSYQGRKFEGLHADTLHVLKEATPYNHETHILRPSLIKGEPDVLVPRHSMRVVKFELGRHGVRFFFSTGSKRRA